VCPLILARKRKSTSICQPLQAAIGVYASDQQLVLQSRTVSDVNTPAKITKLVDLVAGTVNAITSAIPSCIRILPPLEILHHTPPIKCLHLYQTTTAFF
jgi:hypothetical protein